MAGGFGRHLVRLLQAYANTAKWARSEGALLGGGGCPALAEMAWLVGALPEFAPLADCVPGIPLFQHFFDRSPQSNSSSQSKHTSVAVSAAAAATTLKPFIQRLRNPANHEGT